MKSLKSAAVLAVLLAFVMVLSGCDAYVDIAENARPSGVSQEMTSSQPDSNSSIDSTASDPDDNEIEIAYPLEMFFSSGAGAWFTELTINADGSFEGRFQDSNMGETGEGYPEGTVYECNFRGTFSALRPVNDYTFALTLESLEWDGEIGETRIEDKVLYKISFPYGLMNTDSSAPAKNFLLYTPEAPLEEMRENFLSWWPERFNPEVSDKLMYYGLRNTETDEGFFTFDEI